MTSAGRIRSARIGVVLAAALAVGVISVPPAIAAAATQVDVIDLATTLDVGTIDNLSVEMKDAANALDASYTGTVTFSASCGDCFTITPNNGAGGLKAYTFVQPGDTGSKPFALLWTQAGTHAFTASATLTAGGPATDTVTGIVVSVGTTTTTSTTTTSSTTTTTTTIPPAGPGARPLVVRGDTWYLRNSQSTGNADATFVYGNPGDTAVTGDWDGNGSITPGVVRGGTWYLRNSSSAGVADATFAYGNPGDTPVVGDWDGNGTATIGVVRDGTWYLRNSNTQGVADVSFIYGNPTDVPVTGDWDATGSTTPGVVRAGVWYIRNSNTQGAADSNFGYGNPGDKPLAADWDGVVSTTPGVVRGGTWYVRNSNTTGVADVSFTYGNPDDKPLVWRP